MKKLRLAAAVAALFAPFVAQTANAATTSIQFDTNGTDAGGVISVSSFDWTQDNALAVEATPLSTDPSNPTQFDLYAQGSLGNFLDSNNNVINGTGLNSDFEITFEAGFSELGVNSIVDGIGAFASFTLDPDGTVNFFNMYYDTSLNSNQLAGTGYGDGTLLMSAVALSTDTSFSVFFATDGNGDGVLDTPTIVALDQNGTNNRPGVGTVQGQGGGQIEASVIDGSVNTDFFLSDFSSLVLDLFFNTSNITPFRQADPAALVVGNAPEYGFGTPAFPNGVNGFGSGNTCDRCDFHFQADANQSFAVAEVPEPGSLALVGGALGIAGLFGFGRRRQS